MAPSGAVSGSSGMEEIDASEAVISSSSPAGIRIASSTARLPSSEALTSSPDSAKYVGSMPAILARRSRDSLMALVPHPQRGGGGPPEAVEGANDGCEARPLHHAAH